MNETNAILESGEIMTVDKKGRTVILEPSVSLAKLFARWLALKNKMPKKHYVENGRKGSDKRWKK